MYRIIDIDLSRDSLEQIDQVFDELIAQGRDEVDVLVHHAGRTCETCQHWTPWGALVCWYCKQVIGLTGV